MHRTKKHFPNAFLLSAVLSWLSLGGKLCCDTVTVCGYASFVCWLCVLSFCRSPTVRVNTASELFFFLLLLFGFGFLLFTLVSESYTGYSVCDRVCPAINTRES